ncbi:Aquaporin AQPcic [Eumeta japonica]|uniref:Aquaporin AQPcic n=1 Tax=Eumeta variegata TaxID=151549 RepID=A0A4C1XSM8_EUMVA|nr:Aquaporin AQPcic [Eumeta japonica]
MKFTLPTNGVANDSASPKRSRAVLRWCSEKWRAVLGELISTSLLVLFGCMACVPYEDGAAPVPGYAPLAFGFAVLFNIQAFGHISGAHMNPAVSVAAVVWGSLSPALAVFYIIAQCCGSILGFGLLTWFTPLPLEPDAICSTLPRTGVSDAQALVVEIALSAALMLLNCAVWDPVNGHLQDGVPLKFGFVIAGLSFAGAHFTGASMNPARSLGPALWNGSWESHWVYWLGPIISGVVFTLLYKHVLTKRKQED